MKDIQLISFEKNPVKKLTGLYYANNAIVERYETDPAPKFTGVYGAEDSTSKVFAIVTGKKWLAQKVLKLLFTLRGSDALSSSSGSSLYEMLKFYKIDDVENVRTSLPVLVKLIETQIKDQQLIQSFDKVQLKNDELLDTLVLEKYEFDHLFGGWILGIKINTKAGTSVNITIP